MRLFGIITLFVFTISSFAQNPEKNWKKYSTPEEAGFSSKKLEAVTVLCDSINKTALFVVYKGNVLISYGEYSRRFYCASVRKSFTSALYGIYSGEGVIDISKTLGELSITDKIELTAQEKTATVEDLLKSRSGVYLPAIGETKSMKENRPKRGSHKPNTFFYYNNWDFNVLGTILKQETKQDITQAFYEKIAKPLQMEDYRIFDGLIWHDNITNTMHSKYDFKLSARDMARFGVLYLNNGKWNNKNIISEEWIKKSFIPYSNSNEGGYGYLWWINKINDNLTSYSARGWGGHVISIIPEIDLVFVMRNDTYFGKGGEWFDYELIRLIAAAKVSKTKINPKLITMKQINKVTPEIQLTNHEYKKYEQKVKLNGRNYSIKYTSNGLMIDDWHKLVPITKNKFFIEDLNYYIYFKGVESKYLFDRVEKTTANNVYKK